MERIYAILVVGALGVTGCVQPCNEGDEDCGGDGADSGADAGNVTGTGSGTGGGNTSGSGTGGLGGEGPDDSTTSGGSTTDGGGSGGGSTTDGGGSGGGGSTTDGTTSGGGNTSSSTSNGNTTSTSTTGNANYPTPDGEWRDVTSNLVGLESECGDMGAIEAKPDEDLLFAGVALQGLWASRNGGDSWEPLGTGAGSDVLTNRPWVFVFDPDDSETWWEAGIYNGVGVYKTTDNGVTLLEAGDVRHNDCVGIDFTDPERKVMLAGAHEAPQKLFRSIDGGATWTDIGMNLPEKAVCPIPMVLDGDVHMVGCMAWEGGPVGILRTTDGGENWDQVSEVGGGGREPLIKSDGTLYWVNPDKVGLARSKDDGETWQEVNENEVRSQPIELPDGRIAALGSRQIVVSEDEGVTWHPVTTEWPAQGTLRGPTYSAHQKAFFIWFEHCGTGRFPVAEGAVQRYDWDFEAD